MDLREVLSHLQYFYIVATEKSFSKASEKLHISITTVRYHVKALENSLGIKLIDSSNHSFLTDDGLRISKGCKSIFEYSNDVINQIVEEEKNTRFVVTAPVSFGTQLLFPALDYIYQYVPDFDCRLNLTNSYINLDDNNWNIAIRTKHPESNSDYEVKGLMFVKYAAIASKDYLLKSEAVESINDLLNHKIIIYSEEDANWNKIKQEYPALEDLDRDNIICISDNKNIFEIVRGGHGIGILPLYELDNEKLKHSNIEFVLEDQINPEKSNLMDILYVCYPKFSISQDLVRDFIHYLKEYLKNKGELLIE